MNNLTEDDTRTLRRQGDFKAYLRAKAAAARTACEQRRRLVLAHPDLAAQLTQPPLNHTTPQHWSGYVPPDTYNGATNDSPVRAQLTAIVQEAEHRTTHTAAEARAG